MVRKLIGAAIQLAIGEALVVSDQRDGIGRALGLDLEQLMDTTVTRMLFADSPSRVTESVGLRNGG